MSRHEGVSCDSCLKANFRGRRYKCLICYDYDLCAACYEGGATTTRHTTDHPMQCILTRSDFDIFYGGDSINIEQPQTFTCPYCGKLGFTENTLHEHVTTEHTETFEVVCPVCASLPGGDPNHVTDDFAGHLTLEHRSGPRDLISFLDEPTVTRHGGVRRVPHSNRGSGVPRARRSNMHFSSSGGLSSLSPSSRDVDPIAELLSQLSGVRRSAVAVAAAAGAGGGSSSVASTPSQLQQLQMQLQLERHQAARQQMERLPRRQAAAAAAAAANATSGSSSGIVTMSTIANPLAVGSVSSHDPTNGHAQSSQSSSQSLLAKSFENTTTEVELPKDQQHRSKAFVRQLLFATFFRGNKKDNSSDSNEEDSSNTSSSSEENASDVLPVPLHRQSQRMLQLREIIPESDEMSNLPKISNFDSYFKNCAAIKPESNEKPINDKTPPPPN